MIGSRTSAATIASVHARQAVAEIRRELAAGTVSLVGLLSSPGMVSHRKAVARVPVGRLLQSVPGVGESTVRVVCRRAQVDRAARLGALTDVQLARLAAEVQQWDLDDYRGTGPRRRAAS